MPYTLPYATRIFVRQDWDNNGNFTGTYDDVSADTILEDDQITIERGRDQGRVTGGPKVPRAGFVLLNEDRRYATEYAGSPLHGKLQPGHKVQIGRVYGDESSATMASTTITMADPVAMMGGSVEIPLFTGRTEEPHEDYRLGHRIVEVSAYGTIQRLIDTRITYSNGALANFTTGAAMVIALELAGLTSADYVVDADAITNGYTLRQWFVDDTSAWDVCRAIWASSGPPAALYEDGLGRIHFEGRNYRTITSRCLTVQQTFSDTNGAPVWLADLDYTPSHGSVVNDMTIEVETRATQVNQQVWQAGASIAVGTGATVDLLARMNDPIIDIDTPVVTTDYVLTGTALASITVTQLSPFTYRIRLIGGAGSATISAVGTNTGLQLRAKPVPVVSRSQVMGTFDTAPSILSYGKRRDPPEISGAIWKNMSEQHASALIDGYEVAYQAPRAVARMTIDVDSAAMLSEAIYREVSDRVHVSSAWSGVDLDMTIEQIEHEIEAENQHRVTFHLERVVELDWARWDVGQYDIDKFGQ